MIEVKFSNVTIDNQTILFGTKLVFYPGVSYICGENGSGKTTFLNMQYGVKYSNEVEMSIDGVSVNYQQLENVRNSTFSYGTQSSMLFEKLTICENLKLCLNEWDQVNFEQVVRILNFDGVIKSNLKVQ